MVVMFTALPLVLEAGALLAPAAGAVVAGVLEDELLELPHADRARARAASPAAPNIFRIRILLFTVLVVSHRESRTSQPFSSRSVQLISGGRPSWLAAATLRELEPGGQRKQDDRRPLDHQDRVGQPGGERELEAEDADAAGQQEAH